MCDCESAVETLHAKPDEEQQNDFGPHIPGLQEQSKGKEHGVHKANLTSHATHRQRFQRIRYCEQVSRIDNADKVAVGQSKMGIGFECRLKRSAAT